MGHIENAQVALATGGKHSDPVRLAQAQAEAAIATAQSLERIESVLADILDKLDQAR